MKISINFGDRTISESVVDRAMKVGLTLRKILTERGVESEVEVIKIRFGNGFEEAGLKGFQLNSENFETYCTYHSHFVEWSVIINLMGIKKLEVKEARSLSFDGDVIGQKGKYADQFFLLESEDGGIVHEVIDSLVSDCLIELYDMQGEVNVLISRFREN